MKIKNLVLRKLYVMSGSKHVVEIGQKPWLRRGCWSAFVFTSGGTAHFISGNMSFRKATMKEQRDFWHDAFLDLQKSVGYLKRGRDQFLEGAKLNAMMEARWMAVKQKTKKAKA